MIEEIEIFIKKNIENDIKKIDFQIQPKLLNIRRTRLMDKLFRIICG